MSINTTYFKNLNGLRFIAAFSVLIAHTELLKSLHGLPNINDLAFYTNTNGHVGVILFFVLSGFLITYLLLQEEQKNGKISLKHFYVRRMLRIWPLYFLMILVSALVYFLSNNSIFGAQGWWGYFTIFPNVSKAFGYYYDGVVHLWSIGVEEQFYLIWPFLLLLTIKFKRMRLYLLIGIFVFVSLLPHIIWYLQTHYNLFSTSSFEFWDRFIKMFKINSMALGGISGWLIFKGIKVKFFNSRLIRLIIFFLPFAMWYSGIHFKLFNDEIYTILFALILFLFASYDNTINLEQKWLNSLGRISYGIYVYHWLIILGMFEIIHSLKIHNIIYSNIIIYIGGILMTLIISYISFYYFERRFLNLKSKFE